MAVAKKIEITLGEDENIEIVLQGNISHYELLGMLLTAVDNTKWQIDQDNSAVTINPHPIGKFNA